jgi:hypothetical protein
MRVNQEFDPGPHGLKRVKTVNYEVCILGMQSHTAGFRTGSIGLKDLMILESGVRIPLWDVGAGLSDETV